MKNFKSGFNTTGSVLGGRSAGWKSSSIDLNTKVLNTNGVSPKAQRDLNADSKSASLDLDTKVLHTNVVAAQTRRDLKGSHVHHGPRQSGRHVNTNTGFRMYNVVCQDTGFNTRVLMNVKMPVASFAWSSVGGILIGVGLLSAGVIVMITSGGAAAAAGPAVFSAVCSSMGTTGILYASGKAASGEDLDWTCYATETLVSGALAVATLGFSKGLAVAKGVDQIAQLSNAVRAGASAAVQTSATMIRNSLEGRDVCDRVLDTAAAALAGGLLSGAVGGRAGAPAASNAVAVTNATLAREFVTTVVKGSLAGGAAAAVSCATRNAIAGVNLFTNMDEAIAGGIQAGAISGVVSAVVLTAHRVEQRALHNQMFAQRMEQVAAGGVAGGFELALWCEANDRYVIVQDADGTCHTYGSPTAEPPIVMTYEPGTLPGQPGHYSRLESGGRPGNGPLGEFTCLADALDVTPQSLADAVQTRFGATAFRGLSDAQVHAMHGDRLGGTNFAAYEREFLNHPSESVQRLAAEVLEHRGSRAELTLRRNLLARELLASDLSDPVLRDQAYIYNDSIPARTYSVEFSHASINPNFSEDRTNTGFPFANQSVEHVASDESNRLDHHRLGVFVHPTREAVLVSNNNRGLAHHALVSERQERHVWVQNVRYVGEDGSNFARWQNGGHPSIQEATFEHTGVRANAERIRWGRVSNNPGPVPDQQ